MALSAYNPVTNTEALKQIWDTELGFDPTEETKIADWVTEPVGVQKIGNLLNLRKLPIMVTTAYTPSQTSGPRSALAYNNNTAATVTVTPISKFSAVALDRAFVNRCVDDGPYRNGYKKQLMATLNEAVDITGFGLCSSFSQTVSQANIDDAMVRTALGTLALNAKNKFNENTAKLLVVHPGQLQNVWNIPAIKEYQIRGTIGAAVNAQLNAYGLIWRECGNVQSSGGSHFNPLLLKDAWALGWNEKPHILDVQIDGLTESYIAYTEYGWAKWFDFSGVGLVTTP